ncbi:hypothetical protein HRbin28_01315 [bacterium HR28]|nr:hypothetical protein HRbin28_01315 [bacterium HR28]
MDLEHLIQVIEQVRERVEKYKDVLEQNEAQTRISLIEPLLRAFGWLLEDPFLVRVEVRTNNGAKVDYVLNRSDGRPAIGLEARSLGSKLELASSAVVGYAWELRREEREPKYVGITDGLRWLIAEPYNLRSPVCQVDLGSTQQPIPESALRLARVFWRRWWVVSEEARSAPSKSALIPLTALRPRVFEQPPRLVVFPDGTRCEPRTKMGPTWRGLLVTVAEWLVSQGKLRPELAPISVHLKSVRYIVNCEPFQQDGAKFRVPFQTSNGLWLDLNLSAMECVRHARRLCQAVGVDPAHVLVER